MEYSFKKNFFISFFSFILASCSSTIFALPNVEGIQVYQKNLHQFPEHRATLADDIDRYHNADDIWNVLRQEFVLPHYEDNPRVQAQINWIMMHQDFLLGSASHAAPYLYYILQQTRKRHLPAEFVLLPMIESAYNPFAYSSAGAAGLWQMMPGTASGYGIKQNWWYDGRRDVVASTKAALDHVSYLSSFFNHNWLLAIAAYDTGEGNVLNAIHRNIRAGYTTNFWNLPLAQETRDYVPRLLALATIIANPDKYPVYLPPVHNAPYLAQIDVGRQIDLKNAAKLAGMNLKEFLKLNPGYNRMKTDPHGTTKIVLPIESVVQFTENFAASPYHGAIYEHYQVRRGDTLLKLAKRFNSSLLALKKANGLYSNYVKPGTNLLIPQYEHLALKTLASETYKTLTAYSTLQNTNKTKKSDEVMMVKNFDLAAPYTMQAGDTVYMVRANETIETIAKHFHIKAKALRHANQLSARHRVTMGDKLVIPTHPGKLQYGVVSKTPTVTIVSQDVNYTVKKGETLEDIAQKFKVPLPSLLVANLLSSNVVKEGDVLTIPTTV